MNPMRNRAVAEARRWIGTPYHHQASLIGVGADCLGLVRGVWRGLYGCDAELPPAYSRDWAEATAEETLLGAAGRHLRSIEKADMQPGDVLIFRFRSQLPAKHAGILVTPDSFVHAMEGGAACEVPLGPWWRRRIAGVFAFETI
jgi:NlpC/P60 family putative phage cell wall peptidase